MAQRRMFSKTITNSSQFLMMPSSSQALYFHLGMNADDDGFCEHFTVMRMTDSKPDDLRILQAKGYVEVFDDKVLVIVAWKENNYLRSDRYTASKYLDIYKAELMRLTSGIPNGDTGKDRLGKDRLGKDRLGNTPPEVPAVAETMDEEAAHCTQFLYDKIKSRTNPPVWEKKPPSLSSWCKTIEQLHRLDGIGYDDIKKVIEWCTADQFWKSNVLSAGTLRKQFNQLFVKMSAPQRTNQKRGYDPNDVKQQAAMARILGRTNVN